MEIKPAMVAIAAFVVITVIAAVLMPVLDDATTTEVKYTNDGYYRMAAIDNTDTYSLSWSSSAASTFTVNGENMDVSTFGLTGSGSYTFFTVGNGIFRVVVSADGGEISSIQLRMNESGSIVYLVSSTNMSATISGGSITVTLGDTSKTFSFTDAYVIDPDGDYIMKTSDSTSYVMSDSSIYCSGLTGIASASYLFEIDGTVSTLGDTINYYPLTNDAPDLTFSNVVVDSSEVAGFNDLHTFKKISFSATPTAGTAQTVTYSYVIVPYEVTAEKTVHLTASENAILLVIPALLIIAIIIGILAYAIRMRE